MKLKVAVVTWNMRNTRPSEKDISTISKTLKDMDPHVIFVATQEEPTRKTNTLLHKLHDQSELSESYNMLKGDSFTTVTGKRMGRLAGQVLTHKDISTTISQAKSVSFSKHKNIPIASKIKSKGGTTFQIQCRQSENPQDTVVINAASVHLDSDFEINRYKQTNEIMQALDGTSSNITWKDFQGNADDITLFSGDLNYRMEQPAETSIEETLPPVTKTPQSLSQLQSIHGLSDLAGVTYDSDITYYGSGSRNVSGPPTREIYEKDKKRSGSGNETIVCKGGRLDRVLCRKYTDTSDLDDRHVVIEGRETSDHKPVVTMTTVIAAPDAFERAKRKLAKLVKSTGARAPELQDSILNTKDTEEGQQYLEKILNYYSQVQQLQLKQEALRLKKKPDNGLKKIIANRISEGNQFFANKQCLDPQAYEQFITKHLVESFVIVNEESLNTNSDDTDEEPFATKESQLPPSYEQFITKHLVESFVIVNKESLNTNSDDTDEEPFATKPFATKESQLPPSKEKGRRKVVGGDTTQLRRQAWLAMRKKSNESGLKDVFTENQESQADHMPSPSGAHQSLTLS